MLEITYWELFAFITVIWIIVRLIVALVKMKFSVGNEAKMLLVYICIVVIARIVNFPMRHVDGHIGTMKFDTSQMFPLWINLVPVVHLFDVYDGWQINIIGNITMFIPVGLVWPVCFEKLDTFLKTVLAGLGFTLLIEVTQLPFYERCSDVDDMILNITGGAIGALIVFAIRKIKKKQKDN